MLRPIRLQFLLRTVVFVALACAFCAPAFAQSSGIGVGAQFGEPIGINAKWWQKSNTAIVGGLAWSVVDDGATNLYADYVWHRFGLFDVNRGRLPLYLGVGSRVQFQSQTHFGLRTVVGLNYLFGNSPTDVFLEFAPVWDVAPDLDVTLQASLGVRYFIR
ncbi:MAG: hypothetical protein JSW67_13860 [Candidatus Latescibacterota bacterium]|nr:MAG: hypothetical protein JSW67_13860 [Candidatus Latescibacterota bacterium]